MNDGLLTVIMAGGRGTRIASLCATVPKPMLPVAGKPVLERQINCLKRQGCSRFILMIGHLGQQIRDYFRDGSFFGVNIEYIEEKEPLGTAGALYYLKGKVCEDFLLLNGDLIFDVDIGRFLEAHRRKNALATLLTHPNDHPYDSGVILADGDGRVCGWLTKEEERHWYKNRVNAGLHILSTEFLERIHTVKKMDLDRDLLRPIIPEGQMYVYDSPEYVKDMGTPERIREAEEDIRSGLVKAKCLANQQKAVFLDRDGTLNRYVGFLRHIDDFELNEGAAEAVKYINRSGYLAVVVTNQPVIARGEVSWEGLGEIHNKMETLLGEQGAYLDDIFICPHHPDKGFPGERTEYKTVCDCRKPKPGLLLAAAEKYHIDLSKSWMIGDSDNDMKAGAAAGCQCMKLSKEKTLLKCIDEIFKNRKTEGYKNET